ncbi:MAG: hypothetical protein Unbinned4336contig1001_23 [Prokaryotic dsDNA virus sp.]|nr:MAG: hypothetical protein Unbinned4336contig1001_23 [Prokaryotic dsDNA virus sp.]
MKKWYLITFEATNNNTYIEVHHGASIDTALKHIKSCSPRSTVLSVREISIAEIFGMPEEEVWRKCDHKISEINKRKETRDWISSN